METNKRTAESEYPKKGLIKTYVIEISVILIGCIIYALSVILISPVSIIPGSVIGIAVILNSLFHSPIGLVNMAINLPLMVMSTKFLGRKLLAYTILTLLGTSLLIDWLSPLSVYVPRWNPIIITMLGGLLMGIGAGLLLRAGATMGGTTAIARLFQIKYPDLRLGNALLLMDSVIIFCGAFLLRDYKALLYSVIYTFVCMKTIDFILYGLQRRHVNEE